MYSRFHDKVVIEEELNELRRQNGNIWETTKYHLKLAKTNASLRNIEQLTFVSKSDNDETDDERDRIIDGYTEIKKNGNNIHHSETQFIENVS